MILEPPCVLEDIARIVVSVESAHVVTDIAFVLELHCSVY